jgi:predicted SAM-dependent methyltransferase
MRIDVGCGRFKQEGFVGVDRYVGGDIVASMDRLPFADDSCEHVYSSHALEHLPKNKIVPALMEWGRVLKEHYVMEIRVPDLVWCCEHWLLRRTNDWWMDTIFGNQEHEGEFHKTGFTPEIMKDYIKEAGLRLVSFYYTQSHDQQTMIFLVSK